MGFFMRFLSSFFVFLMLSSQALAANEQYCAGAKTNADLVQCLSKTYANVQNELRVSYEALMESQSAENRAELAETQKAWLVYRDANCHWEAANKSNQSLERIYELSCLIRVSEGRQRALLQGNMPITEQRKLQGYAPRWMNVFASAYPGTYWKHEIDAGHDLNCDGKTNYVISGMRLPVQQIQGAKKDLWPAQAGYENYKILLGIAAMGETGKPETSVFDFPVRRVVSGDAGNVTKMDEADNDRAMPYLCSPNPMISVIPQMDALDSAVAEVSECIPKVVKIHDPGCGAYQIEWQEDAGFVLTSQVPHKTTE